MHEERKKGGVAKKILKALISKATFVHFAVPFCSRRLNQISAGSSGFKSCASLMLARFFAKYIHVVLINLQCIRN